MVEEITQNPVFRKYKRIETEYKFLRTFAIVCIIGSLALSGFSLWYAQYIIEKNRKQVYVLENGKSLLMAYRNMSQDNRPAEMKSHAKMITDRIFTISPDRSFIEDNLKEVAYLGDNSLIKFINNLKENKYYDNMIAGSVSQEVIVEPDGIALSLNSYPYVLKIKAKLKATRRSSITLYEVILSMNLINVPRSDLNPHGFLAEDFTLQQQSEIEVIERKI